MKNFKGHVAIMISKMDIANGLLSTIKEDVAKREQIIEKIMEISDDDNLSDFFFLLMEEDLPQTNLFEVGEVVNCDFPIYSHEIYDSEIVSTEQVSRAMGKCVIKAIITDKEKPYLVQYERINSLGETVLEELYVSGDWLFPVYQEDLDPKVEA